MDTFAIDNLPPVEKWPEFSNLAELDYPEKRNCGSAAFCHKKIPGKHRFYLTNRISFFAF
ncbi:MAG: hypothetical protein MK404_06325 [SAR324 cluster bacterium]|jgi:hypothetical protein|nr:hypothetical protein [SAR324 cluster bacterium]